MTKINYAQIRQRRDGSVYLERTNASREILAELAFVLGLPLAFAAIVLAAICK